MKKTEKTSPGKLAAKIEGLMAGLPLDVPFFAGDLISQASGRLMELADIPLSEGAEYRIRGILAASTYKATGLRIGRGVILRGRKRIRLGNDVSIGDGAFLSATGDKGRIEIGSNTHIDVRCILYGQGGLTIGEDCAIASGVIIYSQTNQYDAQPLEKIVDQGTRYALVTIGSDVWIGAGAKILPGVIVGDHAIIGAGAVVNRDVAPWKVVVGVPARVVKDRRGEA